MPSFTLAILERRVWDQLDGNAAEFPEVYVRRCLNQALCRLNMLVGYQQDTIPIPGFTQPNVLQYPTPPEILIPIRLDLEGKQVEKVSLRRLAREYRYWATDTTATMGPIDRWVPLGLSQFIIHPMDAYGGQLMEMTGITPIVQLVQQGDAITLDDQFADILIEYAKIRALAKETGQSFQNALAGFPVLRDKIMEMSIWEREFFPDFWFMKVQGVRS